jgi:hypothetical protein
MASTFKEKKMKVYAYKFHFYLSAENKADAYESAVRIFNYLADVNFQDDGVVSILLDNQGTTGYTLDVRLGKGKK